MRKLKNYELYLKRLTLFAAAVNVKIVLDEFQDDGVWVPLSGTIRIDDRMSESDIIATILHELGHSMDDILSKTEDHENAIFSAYKATYKNKQNKKQLQIVLDSEHRGWAYGRDIAKRLRIRLGKWFDDAEAESLQTYKDS